MLNAETIKANACLSALTDEQITAITELSKNDEDSVISARFGEVYRQMDATIENATGIKREGDEKTYVYLERATKSLAEKAKTVDGLNAKISDLQKANEKLNKAIAEGGTDKEIQKKLEQSQKDLADVTAKFNELQGSVTDLTAKHAAEMLGLRMNSEFANAMNGINLKNDMPKAVLDVCVQNAIAKVKAMNPEFVDGKLVFKDEAGAIRKNQANKLEPFTAQELITAELKNLGVLAEGRKQEGAGTKAPTSGGEQSTIDLSSARTRTEANTIITNALMQRGIPQGTNKFNEEFQKAYNTDAVKALPLK